MIPVISFEEARQEFIMDELDRACSEVIFHQREARFVALLAVVTGNIRLRVVPDSPTPEEADTYYSGRWIT